MGGILEQKVRGVQVVRPELYRSLPPGKKDARSRFPPRGTGRPGNYLCAGCGETVFRTRELFPARTLWPVFWAPFAPDRIWTQGETEGRIMRKVVQCRRCGAFLGYVFEDGRPPTGVRYFISASALLFVERQLPPEGGSLPYRSSGIPRDDRA